MRHRLSGKKLNRAPDHRQALLTNLARSFFINDGRLESGLAKIQACRRLVEKMICQAGKGDLVSRRWLYRFFPDQVLVNRIVKDFGVQFASRHGGYTRVILVKKRQGDNAVLARLELVEPLASAVVKSEQLKEAKKSGKKVAAKKTADKVAAPKPGIVAEKIVKTRVNRLGKIARAVVKKRGDK